MRKAFCSIPLLLVFLLASSLTVAQSGAPTLTSSAEYDIGFDCPMAQALSPDKTVLWVLMQGCLTRANTLQAFSVADGSRVETASDFSADLEPLRDSYVSRFNTPMGFTPDGVLDIRANDSETYDVRSLRIAVDGADAAPFALSDEAMTALFRPLTDYPEATVYSPDHAWAAVIGTTELTIVDLIAGKAVFALPVEQENNAFAMFSPDGGRLYVARLDNPDDVESNQSTLTTYSLPDGTPAGSVVLPSFIFSVSPDGRYAAVEEGSNDGTWENLYVVDMSSGSVGEPVSLYEPPGKVMACANDGRDLSDVDFQRSGRLTPAGIDWLPDSSGFVMARSYGGEGAGGGRPCLFDHSRLNHFTVE